MSASLTQTELPVPAALSDGLAGVRRLGVAYSGGVDSSVLLAAAVRHLGPDQVVAILGVSPSLAADEHTAALATAAFIGARVVQIRTNEGEREAYRRNGPDRCFHCKDELFTRIDEEILGRYHLDAIAYGENADDAVRSDRPGSKAAVRHQVLRPLAGAGLDKAAVRELARSWQLPCAEKPAAPCLASRIPHFEEVTAEKLAQIDKAESALRRLGLTDMRVRHHGEIARIELPASDLVRAASDPLRQEIRRAVLAAGFRYAVVDLGGMMSGAFTLTVLGARAEDPLAGIADLDLGRTGRRGYPEAIYCEGNSVEQVSLIAAEMAGHPDLTTLFTRADDTHAAAVLAQLPDAVHDATARLLAWPPEPPTPTGRQVLVVAAGTSDLPVAREAYLTARYLGRAAEMIVDVGVAGLHRILARLDTLRRAGVIVVAAGMDGALPSVVAGLVEVPVIALPTSVGYGASFSGIAALLTMLNSCSPGVSVVNIDNGYGAGYLAAQISAPA